MNKENIKPETIIFKNIEFRRYPESKRRTDSIYYTASSCYYKQGIRRLHTEIWKDKHGEILKGYVIHHKDGNSLNNNIENLECIKRESHQSSHVKEYCENNKEKIIKNLNNIRPLSKKWHKTKEGKKLHAKLAKNLHSVKHELVCKFCGKKYLSTHKTGKFCSRSCEKKFRRKSGIDNEQRICALCGSKFITNKNTKIKYCSRKCAGKIISKKMKGRIVAKNINIKDIMKLKNKGYKNYIIAKKLGCSTGTIDRRILLVMAQ